MTWRDDRRVRLADPIMGGRAEEAQPRRGSSAGHAKEILPHPNTLCSSARLDFRHTASRISDGNAITGAGGTDLTYCGVPYSVAAVQTGQYPLWAYEHLYYLTASSVNANGGAQTIVGGSGVAQNVADAIADKIYSVDATAGSAGVLLSSMSVTRTESGALVK